MPSLRHRGVQESIDRANDLVGVLLVVLEDRIFRDDAVRIEKLGAVSAGIGSRRIALPVIDV